MITDIETYFADGCGRCKRFASADCSARKYSKALALLRDICLELSLTECVKWGHPCYVHGARNIAILGAFRNDVRLTFFNGSLLKDPENILEKRGPNTQQSDILKFTDAAQIKQLTPVIRSYLQEAVTYAEAGIKPVKAAFDVTLPDELIDAMDADPELADAFERLTPGRQRSYVIHLASAKKSETRVARINSFRGKILAGKGANERG